MLWTPAILGQGSKRRSLSDVVVDAVAASQTLVDSASPSFAGVSLGAAADDRAIYVGVMTNRLVSGGAHTHNAMTVAGVAARREAQRQTSAGSSHHMTASLWSAYVPTGTTGSIDITMSDSVENTVIVVYRAINLRTINAWKAYTYTGSNSFTTNLSVDVPKGGAAICLHMCRNDDGYTFSFNGVTQDYNAEGGDTSEGSGMWYGSGHAEFSAAQTALAVGVTRNDQIAELATLAVSLR